MKVNDDALHRIRSVIKRLAHDGKVIARSDNSVNGIFPVAINAVQGEALRNWVVKEKAAHTIEIGLACSDFFVALEAAVRSEEKAAVGDRVTISFKLDQR